MVSFPQLHSLLLTTMTGCLTYICTWEARGASVPVSAVGTVRPLKVENSLTLRYMLASIIPSQIRWGLTGGPVTVESSPRSP